MSENKYVVHRHIERVGIEENGGLILEFKDGSHTYMEPKEVQTIITYINDLVQSGQISYEEE